MFGTGFLSAAALLVLASSPGGACQPPSPAEISIVPKTQEVRIDHSKSMVSIQSKKTDTVNPYDFGALTHTQGFMEGSITMIPSVKLNYTFDPQNRSFCFWYEKIEIVLEISPSIVIAREVYADPCMRKAVLAHEMKHVQVDRAVVNKYAKTMGGKLYETLSQRGFSAGPVPEEHGQAAADRMQETVYGIVEHEYKKMSLERAERQQAVDSLSEYESVGANCKDAPRRKTNAYSLQRK